MSEANTSTSAIIGAGTGRHGRYIGRVGALAVALGVGAAIATTPGVAWAGPETDSTKNADAPGPASSGSADPKPDATGDIAAATPQTDPRSPKTATVVEDDSPTDPIKGVKAALDGAANEDDTTNDDITKDDITEDDEDDAPEDGTDDPGLADTESLIESAPPPERNNTPRDAAPALVAPITSVVAAVVNVSQAVVSLALPNPATTAPVAAPSVSARAAVSETTTTAIEPDTTPAPDFFGAVTRVVASALAPFFSPGPEAPPAPTLMWAVLAWVRREIDTTVERFAGPPAMQTSTSEPVAPIALARAAAPTTLAAAAAPPPPPPSGLLPTVTFVVAGVGNIVGGVLGFLGGLIGGVVNAAPTARPTIDFVDNYSGGVFGQLNATDPNGDLLSYAVSTQAANGVVEVNEFGEFYYTPKAAARLQAAATPGADVDRFTITITDARGARTTVAVTNVPITPNRAPVKNGAPTIISANPDTGVVTGNLNVSDPDGDFLSFQFSQAPGKGAVTFGPGSAFTYTPSQMARDAANYTAGADFDSFAVTVLDGRGGSTNVQVQNVPVAQSNPPPVITQLLQSLDRPSGTVTIIVSTQDSGGGGFPTIRLNGAVDPSIGTVTPDGLGRFIFTPTPKARIDAFNTPSVVEKLNFTVEVNDGVSTVTAPITVIIDATPTPAIPLPPGLAASPVGFRPDTGAPFQLTLGNSFNLSTVDDYGRTNTISVPLTGGSNGGTIYGVVSDPRVGTDYGLATYRRADNHTDVAAVIALRPNGTTAAFTVPLRNSILQASVNPVTGNLYLASSSDTTNSTDVIVVRPDGTYSTVASAPGQAYAGPIVFNPRTGSAYLTTSYPAAPNGGPYIVTTLRSDGTTTANSTPYFVSRVTVDPVSGAAYLTTIDQPGELSTATVLVLESDGSLRALTTLSGSAVQGVTVESTGRLLVATDVRGTNSTQPQHTTNVIAIGPGGSTAVIATVPGGILAGPIKIEPATGNRYLLTESSEGSQALTIIGGGDTPRTLSLPGRFLIPGQGATGDDFRYAIFDSRTGNTYVTTLDGGPTPVTYLTTIKPNGAMTTLTINGFPPNGYGVVINPVTGTVYQVVGINDPGFVFQPAIDESQYIEVTGGSSNVLAVHALHADGSVTVTKLPGGASVIAVDPRTGAAYLTTYEHTYVIDRGTSAFVY